MTRGSPLVIGLADLQRHAGTRRAIETTATLEGLVLEGLEVRAGPEVAVTLVAESLTDGLVVTGTATTTWHGTCRRCLEPVSGELAAEVREVWSSSIDAAEDVLPMPTEDLDLGELVREALLLALPLAPLCEEACRGPAPERFPTAVEADDDAEQGPARDPRWAALDQLDLGDA